MKTNDELHNLLEKVFIDRILFAGETSEIEMFNSPDRPSRDLIVLLGYGNEVIKDIEQAIEAYCNKRVRAALSTYIAKEIEAQRQADLEKISFHAGIDLKTLQGYLESNIEPNKETEQGE